MGTVVVGAIVVVIAGLAECDKPVKELRTHFGTDCKWV